MALITKHREEKLVFSCDNDGVRLPTAAYHQKTSEEGLTEETARGASQRRRTQKVYRKRRDHIHV